MEIHVLKTAFFLWFFISYATCQNQDGQIGFDLEHPDRVIELPKKLKEISGLTYSKGKLYAIQDEKGNLYEIDLKTESVEKYDFAEDGDYESLEVVDSFIYALTSNGDCYKIKILGPDSVFVHKLYKFVDKDLNLEAMGYDAIEKKILIGAKKKPNDDKKEFLKLDPANDQIEEKPFLILQTETLQDWLGSEVQEFNPSGLAIQPQTQWLYILSHPEQQILVLDLRKKGLIFYQDLDDNMFLQPEGICFGEQGNTLYISSEGKGDVPAKIFIFNKQSK